MIALRTRLGSVCNSLCTFASVVAPSPSDLPASVEDHLRMELNLALVITPHDLDCEIPLTVVAAEISQRYARMIHPFEKIAGNGSIRRLDRIERCPSIVDGHDIISGGVGRHQLLDGPSTVGIVRI